MNIDNTLYCGLILNELVTNAYKHAFDTSGSIGISLHQENKTFILHVKDNGRGFKIPHTQSLGLNIVSILIKKQLFGTMTIDTTNEGSSIIIQWNEDE